MRKSTALGVLLLAVAVHAQQAPEQTAAGLKPAPGLELKLWAAEPMLSNPSNIAIDERGRVWVTETVNYRLRGRPDLRPAGDRILILEDTNQDGRADKVTVFDQNPEIRSPLGIAVLGDKVFVSQAPNLTVYTKDANDHILKKEIFLTGWRGVDHDHGLHALVFGPDGRYYFNTGNWGMSVTDRSGRRVEAVTKSPTQYFEGVALRVNPDGTDLTVVAQNFRNPYELALDSFGTIFQTDNDDDGSAATRLLYLMPGGNYGYHGPFDRTWLEDGGTHWHTEVPGVAPMVLNLGAGGPAGLMVYEGKLLPEKYRGQLIHADSGKRIVAAYTLSNDGAGYAGRSEDLVTGGDDTWFRPADVAAAPDGSVFIADWYDPGAGGHQMGDPGGARGRIYRVAPTGVGPSVPKIDLQSPQGLADAFGSPNQDVMYQAHEAVRAQGAAAAPLLQRLWRDRDVVVRARALWLLAPLGDEGRQALSDALRDPDPRFRLEGIRVAAAAGADIAAVAKPLWHDPSPQVRREIALALQDPGTMTPAYLVGDQHPASAEWLDAMSALASQYDGRDRWYLEALGIAARGREDALYARLKQDHGGRIDAALEELAWEFRPKAALADLVAAARDASLPMPERAAALKAIGVQQWPEAQHAIEGLITDAATPDALAGEAFAAYGHQMFSLWPDTRTSPALPQVLARAFGLPGTQAGAVKLADGLGDPRFLPDLQRVAESPTASPEARAEAIQSVASTHDARYFPTIQALAASGPTPLRVAAVRAAGDMPVGVFELWAQQLVVADVPNEVRVQALRSLARTPRGVSLMLDLVEQGRMPAELKSLTTNLVNGAGKTGAPRSGGFGQGDSDTRFSVNGRFYYLAFDAAALAWPVLWLGYFLFSRRGQERPDRIRGVLGAFAALAVVSAVLALGPAIVTPRNYLPSTWGGTPRLYALLLLSLSPAAVRLGEWVAARQARRAGSLGSTHGLRLLLWADFATAGLAAAIHFGGVGNPMNPIVMAAVHDRAAHVLPARSAKGTAPVTSVMALEATYRGDAVAGRNLFENDLPCAGCHSLGGPKRLGPDLSSIGAKYGKQALLDNILNPSDAIAPEYVMTTFVMKSGEPVMGLVSADTPEQIVVKTAGGQEVRVKPADVKARAQSHQSLMPDGLLDNSTPQQIADLLEFLSSLKDEEAAPGAQASNLR